MTERIETVIIGGGQAGLAMSYHLSRLGREHVILEAKWPGHRWRTERWDAFAYQFPNWTLQLPGYGYQGDDPDGFIVRDEVARFVEGYAAFIRASVRCDTRVTDLREKSGAPQFVVESTAATIEADNVIVATGPYQRPAIPRLAASMPPWVFQVHSSSYRNPQQLPPGAVLVVGSAASGCQIAEDLQESGRQIYLAVGSHRRIVRRYRERDIIWWLRNTGRSDRTVESVPPEERRPIVVLTGVKGGHDLDVWRLAANGAVLLGHLQGVEDETCTFGADLAQTLTQADAWCNDLLRSIDDYIEKTGLHAPEPEMSPPRPAIPVATITLDLRAAGIRSVVWATGFRDDFGWMHVPVFDGAGKPVHRRGVTQRPGLYFLGLSWLHTQHSASLLGAGEDAKYLAEHIGTRRLRMPVPQTNARLGN